ncbi:MAG: hypothetical protein GXY05_13490, partial [Clostridiales bacterium]|nr:hypothetical protein [Clostridiales bacterium]
MAKLTKSEIYGLQNRLSKIAFTLTGKRMRIKQAKNGELGFTSEGDEIFVAFDHPEYNDLDTVGIIRMIKGITVHELMHQLQTDFAIYVSTIQSVDRYAQQILGQIYNILEDSAIENFASEYVSDSLFSDLNFTRATIYSKSQPIDSYNDPFVQFIYASIQYGDAGLIKGEFTFKEAYDIFVKCLPIMNKAVEEPENIKRSKYAKQIYDISQPLWKKHAEDAEMMDKLMKELEKALKDLGKGKPMSAEEAASRGSGKPIDPMDPDSKPSSSERSKRRKVTFKRVTAEEFKKAMEESEEGCGGSCDGDIEVLIPDEPVELPEKDASSESDSISMPGPASESKKKKKEDSGGSSSSGEKPDGSDDLEDDSSGASGASKDEGEESSSEESGKDAESESGSDTAKDSEDDTSGASDDPESSREEGEASSSGKASEAIDGTPSGKPP